jgi:hypothetical protein
MQALVALALAAALETGLPAPDPGLVQARWAWYDLTLVPPAAAVTPPRLRSLRREERIRRRQLRRAAAPVPAPGQETVAGERLTFPGSGPGTGPGAAPPDPAPRDRFEGR